MTGNSPIACRLLLNISIATFEALASSASWDESYFLYSVSVIDASFWIVM
jgi:hypothetical protein